MELGVLWLVDLDPGHTQADYARFQRRDLTTFGRIVDKLERQKLLQRKNSEEDRRANHLSLTDQGRKVLKAGKERALKVERELFSVLGKDVNAFRSALVSVLDLPK